MAICLVITRYHCTVALDLL